MIFGHICQCFHRSKMPDFVMICAKPFSQCTSPHTQQAQCEALIPALKTTREALSRPRHFARPLPARPLIFGAMASCKCARRRLAVACERPAAPCQRPVSAQDFEKEVQFSIIQFCMPSPSQKFNGIASASRIFNILWRRMLRPIVVDMIQDLCRDGAGMQHLLALDTAELLGAIDRD